jgi:hypothetical protein
MSTDDLCRRIQALATHAPDADYEAGSISADVRKALDAKGLLIAELRGLVERFDGHETCSPELCRWARRNARIEAIDAALKDKTDAE